MTRNTSICLPNNVLLSEPIYFLNDFNNYWLRADGRITSKKKWFDRLVQWIQNIFFDKTISDAWCVFEKFVTELTTKREFITESQKNGMKFVVKFLYSRKDKLNKWLKANPSKLQYLQAQLNPEINDCLGHAIEKVYAYSRLINIETLAKKPAINAFCSELDLQLQNINELKLLYEQIPLNNEECALVSELGNAIVEGDLDLYLEASITEMGFEYDYEEDDFFSYEKFTDQGKENISALSDMFNEYIENLSNKVRLAQESETNETNPIPAKILAENIFETALKKLSNKSGFDFNSLIAISHKRNNFSHFIECINNRDTTVVGLNDQNLQLYYEQLEFFLKNILFQIKQNAQLAQDSITDILNELARASEECFARWLEEAEIQYKAICGRENQDLEQQLLSYTQELKEQLFLEILSPQQDHNVNMLNAFRVTFASEFGLEDKNAQLDNFRTPLNPKHWEALKNAVLYKYHGRILRGVKDNLNLGLDIKGVMNLLIEQKFLN